jgi:single-strand DNA-binding protein
MPDGGKAARFSVATAESWVDPQGLRQERTDWHTVVVRNTKTAEILVREVGKGSRVLVEGRLQTRKYTDKNNIERSITEVVVQPPRGEVIVFDYKKEPVPESSPLPGA